MSERWVAEDLPSYLFSPREERRPMTDEDAAMSAPEHVAYVTDEEGARSALAGRLRLSSAYNFIRRGGETEMYLQAAAEILSGARMVQLHGRVYRVRNTAACAVRHWHGPCEVCTPDEWTVYPKDKS